MVRDADATRARLLEASIEEFSNYGLAGARVDRIAAAAQANKRAIYEHFSDKDGLFAAAMEAAHVRLTEAVPLTEDDLPGYVGRLFDYHRDHPQVMRMHLWRQLERPAAGGDGRDYYAEKLAGMDPSGSRTAAEAFALLLTITSLPYGWILGPEDLFGAAGVDPEVPADQSAYRAAIVEAARRITA